MSFEDTLTEIPGELLKEGVHALPDARTSKENTQRVIVRLPDGKRAQITFTRLRTRRKKRPWIWTPCFAVLLPDDETNVADSTLS